MKHHYQMIKKAFYSELNFKNITDEDYAHAPKVFEESNLKNLGDIMTCMLNTIHYCLQIYFKTLGTSVLEYMNLTLLIFCLRQD